MGLFVLGSDFENKLKAQKRFVTSIVLYISQLCVPVVGGYMADEAHKINALYTVWSGAKLN